MVFFFCMLIVCGAVLVLWVVTAVLLFPAADADMTLNWMASGDCPDLEFRVRAYLWFCGIGIFRAKLRIFDCGMTHDARMRAKLLTKDHALIEFVDGSASAALLDGTETDERDRTGDPARSRADGDISKSG